MFWARPLLSGAAHLVWCRTSGFAEHPDLARNRHLPLLGPRLGRPGTRLFAIGLDYRAHALESGFAIPEDPPVFTKFVSSITGPITEVALPHCGHTDWEVELVVTVGAEA